MVTQSSGVGVSLRAGDRLHVPHAAMISGSAFPEGLAWHVRQAADVAAFLTQSLAPRLRAVGASAVIYYQPALFADPRAVDFERRVLTNACCATTKAGVTLVVLPPAVWPGDADGPPTAAQVAAWSASPAGRRASVKPDAAGTRDLWVAEPASLPITGARDAVVNFRAWAVGAATELIVSKQRQAGSEVAPCGPRAPLDRSSLRPLAAAVVTSTYEASLPPWLLEWRWCRGRSTLHLPAACGRTEAGRGLVLRLLHPMLQALATLVLGEPAEVKVVFRGATYDAAAGPSGSVSVPNVLKTPPGVVDVAFGRACSSLTDPLVRTLLRTRPISMCDAATTTDDAAPAGLPIAVLEAIAAIEECDVAVVACAAALVIASGAVSRDDLFRNAVPASLRWCGLRDRLLQSDCPHVEVTTSPDESPDERAAVLEAALVAVSMTVPLLPRVFPSAGRPGQRKVLVPLVSALEAPLLLAAPPDVVSAYVGVVRSALQSL
jgi:hypothetical protein